MEIREGNRHTFCFRVEIITNLTILFVSLYFKVPQRYESMLSRALNIHRHESKLDYVIFDLYVYSDFIHKGINALSVTARQIVFDKSLFVMIIICQS